MYTPQPTPTVVWLPPIGVELSQHLLLPQCTLHVRSNASAVVAGFLALFPRHDFIKSTVVLLGLPHHIQQLVNLTRLRARSVYSRFITLILAKRRANIATSTCTSALTRQFKIKKRCNPFYKRNYEFSRFIILQGFRNVELYYLGMTEGKKFKC